MKTIRFSTTKRREHDAGALERLPPGIRVGQVGDDLDEDVADLREQLFHVGPIPRQMTTPEPPGPGVVLNLVQIGAFGKPQLAHSLWWVITSSSHPSFRLSSS